MTKARKGDVVQVHYTGRLEDGTLFGTSEDQGPVEFTLGEGHVIPGVEKAVEGLEVGEKITTEVSSDEAYGPWREDLVIRVALEQFPGDGPPSIGDRYELKTDSGHPVKVTVLEVEAQSARVDANHPLAGKALSFELELAKIA